AVGDFVLGDLFEFLAAGLQDDQLAGGREREQNRAGVDDRAVTAAASHHSAFAAAFAAEAALAATAFVAAALTATALATTATFSESAATAPHGSAAGRRVGLPDGRLVRDVDREELVAGGQTHDQPVSDDRGVVFEPHVRLAKRLLGGELVPLLFEFHCFDALAGGGEHQHVADHNRRRRVIGIAALAFEEGLPDFLSVGRVEGDDAVKHLCDN